MKPLTIILLTFLLDATYTVLAVSPSFDVPSVNVTVVAGQSAVLPCSIKDIGEHKVVWVSQDDVVLTYQDMRIIDDNRISVLRPFREEWNLQILNVKYADQGEYRCAINTVPMKSKTVFLNVKAPSSRVNAINKVDNTEACDQMTGAIVDLVTNAIAVARGFGYDLRKEIQANKAKIHYDLSNPSDIRRFSCNLVNIKTIKDLAKFLGEPYPKIKAKYLRSKLMIKMQGGHKDIFKRAHIAIDILIALKRFDFPNFPLKHPEEIKPFLKTMIVKYSGRFLQKLKSDLPTVDYHLNRTATALENARNINDMARALGVNPIAMRKSGMYFNIIKPYVENLQTILESIERIYHLSVKIGLYDLKD